MEYRGDLHPWTLDDLRRRVNVPVEVLLPTLFRLVQADALLDRTAIINPGCSEAEITVAERRITHRLHPLHRQLLALSNGGSLPCTGDISLLAAAVPRGTSWRIVGPMMTAEELAATQVILGRMTHPVTPWILGELPPIFSEEGGEVVTPDIASIIVFADGFGDECWGYVRAKPERIDRYYEVPSGGRYTAASNFEEYPLQQHLIAWPCTPAFVERVRDAVSA